MGDVFFQFFLAFLGIVVGIISQLVQPRAQRQILLIAGLLLFLFAGLWWGFSLGTKEPPSTQPPPTESTLPRVTDTPAPTPSDAPTTPPNPPSDFTGFDFESGTQGWGTSEGEYKLAVLSTSTGIVHSGNTSLELNTELFGTGSTSFAAHNGEDVYRHTEAVVYLDSNAPKGFDQPGPYDLTGKQFSCFVYLPDGLFLPSSPHVYIRLFAKDTKFANLYGSPVDVTDENTNQWIELSLVINVDPNTDFDPKQTNALGARMDSLDGSLIEYSGPIYIDECRIK